MYVRPHACPVVLALVLLAGCCGNRLQYDQFRGLALQDQMSAFNQARHDDCVGENGTAFLDMIAQHGYEAADAMTASLRSGSRELPAHDAIAVLELVHFHGADLRNHEALAELRELAKSAPESRLREEASLAVERITRNDPRFGAARAGR